MKSAAEWIVEHQADRSTDACSLCDVAAEDVLARDIEVLEEAAKLTCYECRDGIPRTENGWLHHKRNESRCGVACCAKRIHDLIAELKRQGAVESRSE